MSKLSRRSSALAAASGTGGGSIFVPVLISFSYLQAERRGGTKSGWWFRPNILMIRNPETLSMIQFDVCIFFKGVETQPRARNGVPWGF